MTTTTYYTNENATVENEAASKLLLQTRLRADASTDQFRKYFETLDNRPLFNKPKLLGKSEPDSHCYKNDGNTLTPGTRYNFYIAYELFEAFPVELFNLYHGSANFALVYSLDFQLRNSDSKIGHGYSSITVYGEGKEDSRTNGNRIWYQTVPEIPKQLDPLAFTRTMAEILRINEVFKIYRWYKKQQ
jgi:hypothetical protein